MRISGKETITDIILRQIRELGESLVVIDQQLSLITPTALSNIHTTMMMKMNYPDDVSTVMRLASLKPDEAEYLRMSKTGWAIVETPDWHKPFLVKFPLFPLEKGSVTDEKLREKMNGYLAKAGLKKVDQNQKGVIRDFRGNDKTEEKEEEIRPNLQPKKGFT